MWDRPEFTVVACARPAGGAGERSTSGAGADGGGGGTRGPMEEPDIVMGMTGSTAIAATNPVGPGARTTCVEGEGTVDGPAVHAAAVPAADDEPR